MGEDPQARWADQMSIGRPADQLRRKDGHLCCNCEQCRCTAASGASGASPTSRRALDAPHRR
eukprot:16038054-Heterocapsa_arctica.AAC.1